MFIKTVNEIINTNCVAVFSAEWEEPIYTEEGKAPGNALLTATLMHTGEKIWLMVTDHDQMAYVEWLLHRIWYAIDHHENLDLVEISDNYPDDEEMFLYGASSRIIDGVRRLREGKTGFSF